MILSTRARAIGLLILVVMGTIGTHLLGDSWTRAATATVLVTVYSQLLVVVPRLRRGLSPWPVSPGRDQARTEV